MILENCQTGVGGGGQVGKIKILGGGVTGSIFSWGQVAAFA